VLNNHKEDPTQQLIKVSTIKSRKLSINSQSADPQHVDSTKRLKCLKPETLSPKTVFSVEPVDSHSVVAKPDKTFRTDQSDSGRAQKKQEESPNRF